LSNVAKKQDLKILDRAGQELMAVRELERDGKDLLIKGKIMGAMPMTARVTPESARAAIKMLTPRLILFILSLPFRKA